MKAKEVIQTIDKLDDKEWQRMKDHMDAKFPNMKLPDMTSFKMMVQLFGMGMQDAAVLTFIVLSRRGTCCASCHHGASVRP